MSSGAGTSHVSGIRRIYHTADHRYRTASRPSASGRGRDSPYTRSVCGTEPQNHTADHQDHTAESPHHTADLQYRTASRPSPQAEAGTHVRDQKSAARHLSSAVGYICRSKCLSCVCTKPLTRKGAATGRSINPLMASKTTLN